MTFGSLFSGIGGIDLGLERAGLKCVWQSEIDPFACQVLAKHWPNIPNLGDIREIDWTTVERADVVAGGYPCQPFSNAGRRAGEHDPRHLWPIFAECLRVVRPRFALLENVAGHLSLGFGSVLSDLAALGYDARWDCIPAAAVGAPHLRDRVFVIAKCQNVAHAYEDSQPRFAEHRSKAKDRTEQRRFMADSNNRRSLDPLRTRWDAPWNGGTDSGRAQWATEPNVGRVAYGIPRRLDRLRGLGNAVVPQVSEHVARIILRMETPT